VTQQAAQLTRAPLLFHRGQSQAFETMAAQEEDEYYCPGMTKTRKVIKSAWVANRGDSTAKEVTVSCCPRGE
jgi:hypothetical protein